MIGIQAHTAAYVCKNGVVSFGQPFQGYNAKKFPLSEQNTIVAPFWADIDIHEGGSINYRVTTKKSDLDVGRKSVRDQYANSGNFEPTEAIIATWNDVTFTYHTMPPPTNTFQITIATDGTKTYTVILIKKMEWVVGPAHGGDPWGNPDPTDPDAEMARIGINTADIMFNSYEQERSGTPSIRMLVNKTNTLNLTSSRPFKGLYILQTHAGSDGSYTPPPPHKTAEGLLRYFGKTRKVVSFTDELWYHYCGKIRGQVFKCCYIDQLIKNEGAERSCSWCGDPHFTTFDRSHYSPQHHDTTNPVLVAAPCNKYPNVSHWDIWYNTKMYKNRRNEYVTDTVTVRLGDFATVTYDYDPTYLNDKMAIPKYGSKTIYSGDKYGGFRYLPFEIDFSASKFSVQYWKPSGERQFRLQCGVENWKTGFSLPTRYLQCAVFANASSMFRFSDFVPQDQSTFNGAICPGSFPTQAPIDSVQELSGHGKKDRYGFVASSLNCTSEVMTVCDTILDSSGPFRVCNASLLRAAHKSCVFDVCATGTGTGQDGINFMACNYLDHVATSCMNELDIDIDWRDLTSPTWPAPTCGVNMHYEMCATPCERTCESPYASLTCSAPCRSGCFCDDGFYQQDGECISIEKCSGCRDDDGFFYNVGQGWTSDDCTQACTCTSSGVKQCNPLGCGTNAMCDVFDTGPECMCAPGFTGDGQTCVADQQ